MRLKRKMLSVASAIKVAKFMTNICYGCNNHCNKLNSVGKSNVEVEEKSSEENTIIKCCVMC